MARPGEAGDGEQGDKNVTQRIGDLRGWRIVPQARAALMPAPRHLPMVAPWLERRMKPFGTPYTDTALRVMFLGAGELGKEVGHRALRLRGRGHCGWTAYAHAPVMQVAHRSHVIDI